MQSETIPLLASWMMSLLSAATAGSIFCGYKLKLQTLQAPSKRKKGNRGNEKKCSEMISECLK
jgi:hypothetical protein